LSWRQKEKKMDNLKCFVCGRLLAGGDLGAIIWSGEYKVVCQGHVPEGASVVVENWPATGLIYKLNEIRIG